MKNRQELVDILVQVFRTRTRQAWLDIFLANGVMAAPVLSIKDSMAFFDARTDGLIVETEHAKLGKLREVRTPIAFSSEPPPAVRRAAPTLGQHTDERLRKTGFSAEEITQWRAAGLV